VAPKPIAVGGIVVFAFGTTLWPVASMALFQQAPVLFFESMGLLGIFSRRRWSPALAGSGFALATLVRPTAVIPLVIMGLFYLGRDRHRFGAYSAGALLPLVVVAVQNRWIWGSWTQGGYSHLGVPFNAPFVTALRGLTVGWWRGMLIYSPILVLGLVGWALSLRRFRGEVERALSFLGISVLMTMMLYAKWADWGGGINLFGYRLQLDVVPSLIVLAVFATIQLPKIIPFAIPLAGLSILTMTWGAAPSRNGWDTELFPRDIKLTSVWRSWENFIDHPSSGLLRLALVAAAGVVIAVIVHRLWTDRNEPLFEGSIVTSGIGA
jgi:hypothetical protein